MCNLLELARAKKGNVSYYEMAKILNVSDQLVRSWKNNKSQPNGLNTLKLTEMADVTPKEAIKLMESGFADVTLMSGIGLLSLAAVQLPVETLINTGIVSSVYYALYIIRSDGTIEITVLCEIKTHLFVGSFHQFNHPFATDLAIAA